MPAQTLGHVLDEISTKVRDDATPETLTLGEVIDAFGRRSYGPLLLVIGLFAISPATIVPGLTWLAAALTLVVAGQMALGLKRIWLPRGALQAELPRDAVLGGIEKSRGFANRIDGLLKPRLTFLSGPPFVNVVALLCIAAALITFPLGLIPFAPLAPGIAVVFFGLGMVARDGLWLLLGTAFVGGAIWLAMQVIL
ncbi:exopolysaccharide biosynthesis protein [Terricaulis silvestris]|uniref:Exopolysaccharide synthesis, ExoD n=1 Tax=Terricaulis silvestris TaxID=2686094 RepID=A0A6I6MHS0_9CAUL|nr:exopolysaccharide biosynthesis protein [Terricaulis silvestris]QGZ93201.1 Exopolysaccharide synthesis, ExoD [Terricaulis silvestris]